MVKNIEQYPMGKNSVVTVFTEAFTNVKYSLSKDGWVIKKPNAIATEFTNNKMYFNDHILLGILGTDAFDKKAKSFLNSQGIEYEHTPTSYIKDFLVAQGYDTRQGNIWIIAPKNYKAPKGTKFDNKFELCNEKFEHGYESRTLSVYMTPITADTKSIIFRVDVPDYIYDQCMLDQDQDQRPTKKYIESPTLEGLHSEMSAYCNQAVRVRQMERDSEKHEKMILISFKSDETSIRDPFNFAYLGQKINTSFNWCIIYRYNDTWGKHNYFTWKRLNRINHSGIDDLPSENSIQCAEKQGRKFYIQGKPAGIMVEWSQEREDFLLALESNFRQLSNNLNEFLKDIDTEKLDKLIENSDKIKLLK